MCVCVCVCSMCRRTFRCTTAHQCSSERAWIDTGTECSNHYSSGELCLTLFVIDLWAMLNAICYIYIYYILQFGLRYIQ